LQYVHDALDKARVFVVINCLHQITEISPTFSLEKGMEVWEEDPEPEMSDFSKRRE
jgi:hypothetical protein